MIAAFYSIFQMNSKILSRFVGLYLIDSSSNTNDGDDEKKKEKKKKQQRLRKPEVLVNVGNKL